MFEVWPRVLARLPFERSFLKDDPFHFEGHPLSGIYREFSEKAPRLLSKTVSNRFIYSRLPLPERDTSVNMGL